MVYCVISYDDVVALRVEHRTSDQEVAGLTRARSLLAQQP